MGPVLGGKCNVYCDGSVILFRHSSNVPTQFIILFQTYLHDFVYFQSENLLEK